MTKLSGRILVDMDATLYDAPFGEACRVMWGADCPPTREAKTWLWYENYVASDQWQKAVEFVHDRLAWYSPFPKAVETLQAASRYFEIIVTSQRKAHYEADVALWLVANDIPAYKRVIRSGSKLKLFQEGDIVIDDAPHNIVGALERGAHVLTLTYPYNRHTEVLGAKHVDDWGQIGEILTKMIEGVVTGVNTD